MSILDKRIKERKGVKRELIDVKNSKGKKVCERLPKIKPQISPNGMAGGPTPKKGKNPRGEKKGLGEDMGSFFNEKQNQGPFPSLAPRLVFWAKRGTGI